MNVPFCDRDEVLNFQHCIYKSKMEIEIKVLGKENAHLGLLMAKQDVS